MGDFNMTPENPYLEYFAESNDFENLKHFVNHHWPLFDK